MTALSLLCCDRCNQTTGDVTYSQRDGRPRCPPCERRADHERRLLAGESWYVDRIVAFAERLYGPDWEQERGWRFCADLFASTRALGGWKAVGVDLPATRRRREVEERPCPNCGEPMRSTVGAFICAPCHFRGWWGRWRDESA